MPRRLVLFVEGKGDRKAVPTLVGRVVANLGVDDALFVDSEPFRVAGVGHLVKDDCKEWKRFLGAAGKSRRDLAAVLLILDGDLPKIPATWAAYRNRCGGTLGFCAMHAACVLADQARTSRAGEVFSLAAVFIMKEFEAWLLAGIESLCGVKLPDGRGVVPSNVVVPPINLEAKRDAKGLLRDQIPGYQETLDQAALAAKVDLSQIRTRCRSFRRLESAIRQLADAVRTGKSIVSPVI